MGRSAAVALFFLFASVAHSEPLSTFRIASWYAGAYSFKGTRNFSHCAASATYNSGITVIFAINKAYHWSMGFASPAWRLILGKTYNIAFTVDQLRPIYARATAISSEQVEVELQDSVPLFKRFMSGHELRVAAADKIFTFDLTNTSKVLPGLLNCVKSYVAPPPTMEANPFAPQSATISNGEVAPSYRAEEIGLLANILSAARITGFQILDEQKGQKNQVTWTTPNKMFGWLSVNTSSTPEVMMGIALGLDAAKCKFKFASGILPKKSDESPQAFTVCGEGESTISVYYLILPRKAGGHYLIATGAVGDREPAREAESSIRSAVLTIDETKR